MQRARHRPSSLFVAAFAVATAVACSSNEDDVCEDVGDCAQGGSSDWIKSCQDEAKALKAESSAAGCGGAFDDYYACAEAHFSCNGATPAFDGCDANKTTLESCLDKAQAETSCGALAAKTAVCAGDGGADAGLPPACTAARDCAASCYLAAVADVCAPRADELTSAASCTASCPP